MRVPGSVCTSSHALTVRITHERRHTLTEHLLPIPHDEVAFLFQLVLHPLSPLRTHNARVLLCCRCCKLTRATAAADLSFSARRHTSRPARLLSAAAVKPATTRSSLVTLPPDEAQSDITLDSRCSAEQWLVGYMTTRTIHSCCSTATSPVAHRATRGSVDGRLLHD